jgi:hypothetical protein
MPVFFEYFYNGLKLSAAPHDVYRKLFKFSRWYWLPYLNGSPLWLDIRISSDKSVDIPQEIKYQWHFKRLSDGLLFGDGSDVINIVPGDVVDKEIFSDLILDKGKYILEAKIDLLKPLKEGKYQTLALFTVQDRDNFYS